MSTSTRTVHPGPVGLFAAVLLSLGGPAMSKPQVVRTLFPTEDVVIASVVADAPRDGAADATGAIQAALDQAAAGGGGVVFLPAGRYRMEGRLVVKEGVTLRGDWAPPTAGDASDAAVGAVTATRRGATARGTLLMPVADRGKADGPPAITLERGSGIREVAIWYPDQKPGDVVPYPWTLRTSETVCGNNYTVLNVTLVNPYQAFKVGPEWNELHTLRNVYGTPLKTGVWVDTTTDIGRLIEVDFSPRWWEESGLPGAPATAEEKAALRGFLLREATGVEMGRSDWEYLYRVRVAGYAVGLKFQPGAQGTTNAVLFGGELTDCGTALQLVELNGIGLSATGCRFTGREHAVHAPGSFTAISQFNTCEFGGGVAVTAPAVLLEGAGTLTFQNCGFAATREAALEARSGTVSLLGCRFAEAGGNGPRRGAHVKLGENVLRARILGNQFQGEPKIANDSRGDVQITHHRFDFARANVTPHQPAPHPHPARRDLVVVTDYGAAPGEADNTAAFARALAAAGKAGGGTVYVPAGNYRFAGEIVVPTGVELRGSFDVPHHTVSGGSVLMPTAGRGKEDGTPFIRLQAHSGARGLTIWYPEQDLRSIAAYPWAIQSTGPGCWLMDVTLANAYQGADFWTYPSDGHVLRYVAGGLLKRGVWVSKCAGDGWVEDLMFNPHYTARVHPSLPQPKYEGDVFGGVIDYQREHLEGMVFGRCAREHVRGTFLYAAHDGIAFRDDGGGANARVIEHGTDTGSRGAVIEATGPKGVEFINAQLVPLGKWEKGAIIVGDGFTGKVAFFNTQIWAGNTSGVIGGKGDVLLQQVNTLSGGFTLKGGRCALENAHFERNLRPHVRVEEGCQAARVIGSISREQLRVENQAGERSYIRGNSLSTRPLVERFTFRTGWEEGEPQGLADTIASQGGGMRSASGGQCRVAEGEAHAGKRALRLSGNADDPAYSNIYFRILEEPVTVNADAVLSYWIRPENERGCCTGVDLLFSDGAALRDSGIQTSDGQGVHPGGPRGKVGEWTQVRVPIGRRFAGKVVAAVLFAYDSRTGGGPFAALLDDLAIESAESAPQRVTATPAGGTYRGSVRVELSAPGASDAPSRGGASGIRYTLDGTPPRLDSPRYDKPIVLDRPGLWEVRFATESADGKLSSRVYGEMYEVVAGK